LATEKDLNFSAPWKIRETSSLAIIFVPLLNINP
jgi:hypothetical protein